MRTKTCIRCNQTLDISNFAKNGHNSGGYTNKCKGCVSYLIETFGSASFIDLTGITFGRLSVISYAGKIKGNKYHYWNCQCSCGKMTTAASAALKTGNVSSCGCLKAELIAKRCGTHGMTKTREWNSWRGMTERCYNPSHKNYGQYGGRGITVCESWHKFENFFRDMGYRPDKKSLDRINVNGNYCLENCKWSTQREQMLNTRRSKANK